MKITIKHIPKMNAVMFSELVSHAKSNRFDQNSSEGYKIIKITDNILHASFILRREIKRDYVDPFDNDYSVQYSRFIDIKFRINRDEKLLELIDPPRSYMYLFYNLQALDIRELTIQDVNFDLQKLISLFEAPNMDSTPLELVWRDDSSYRGFKVITVIKGGMALDGSKKMLSKPKYDLLRIVFSGIHNEEEDYKIAFYQSGKIDVGNASNKLMGAIRGITKKIIVYQE